MYGMVNKAVQDLVVSNFGDEKWQAIKAKAGVEDDVFLSNEGYPDKVTYDLVGAASGVLGMPARDILIASRLGAGPVADAFFVALKLPNLFRRLFGEGAFNAAFVPALDVSSALSMSPRPWA